MITFQNETSLEELIVLCKENDRIAQTDLYNRYKKLFTSYIAKNSEFYHFSDEIINTAFKRIFMKIHLYTYKGSFEGFMLRILKNAIFNFRESNRKFDDNIIYFSDYSLEDEDNGREITFEPKIDNECDSKLNYDALINTIHSVLSNKELIVFMMFFKGYSHKDIAEQLDICVNTSKWHLSEARIKLKKYIKR
jgi:RNA polymerase sigma-70 factor (ECF subfamily)